MLKLIGVMLLSVMLGANVINVVKVVDGDTIKVKDGYKVYNVRLAGIDTPESYLSVKAKRDIKKCKVKDYVMMHLGLTAKEYVSTIYKSGDVIEYEVLTKGRYGRPIVYIKDLEEGLVRNGLALVKHYNKTDKEIVKHLKTIEKTAKDEHLMLWKYLKTNCY